MVLRVLAPGITDRRLVGLAARAREQVEVLLVVSPGELGRVRIQLEHRFADELLPRDAEKALPGAVDAQIAPVRALEEDRLRHGLDQLLDEGELLAQAFRGAHAARVLGELQRALPRAHLREDDPEQQRAGHQAAEQHDLRQLAAEPRGRRGGRAELEAPTAARHVQGGRAAQSAAAALRVRPLAAIHLDRAARRRAGFQVAEVPDDELEVRADLRAEMAVDQPVDADGRSEHAHERLPALGDGAGGHAAPVKRHAQRDGQALLRIGGEAKRLGGRDLAAVARVLERRTPRRLGEQVEAQRALVARQRLEVGDHHARRRGQVAHVGHQAHAPVALREVEPLQVAPELVAIDLLGRLEQAAQADEQRDVLLDMAVQRLPGARDIVSELRFRLARDAPVGVVPDREGDGQAQAEHEERRPGLEDPSHGRAHLVPPHPVHFFSGL
jgi:hypothetical protein